MDAAHGPLMLAARNGDEVVVSACGELDFATSPRLIEAINAALNQETVSCVLDFEKVTFIDSEALKRLILLRRELATSGVDLRLGKCSLQVKRIIDLLGLHSELGCVCDEEPGQSM